MKKIGKLQWGGVLLTGLLSIVILLLAIVFAGCSKKDSTQHEHVYAEYEYNADAHWKACTVCGQIAQRQPHFYKEVSADGETIQCSSCSYANSLADAAHKITFACENRQSAKVYATQEYKDGYKADVTFSRDGAGNPVKDGNGQVYFEAPVGYKADSIEITPSSGYTEIVNTDGKNRYKITGINTDIVVSLSVSVETSEFPAMFISTENEREILSKEDYVTCSVSVTNAQVDYCFEAKSAKIRGRGNTTWSMPKKPYKLKFDKKIDLFGNGAAKSWTLIANYVDPSLIRNYMVYNIANTFLDGLEYTTTTEIIDLYVNGVYCGVYLVCEQNEVGKTRVNISEDLTDTSGNILLDTGYLLESDEYEGNIRINGLEHPIRIDSPDIDDPYFIEHRDEYEAFISNVLQTSLDSLKTEDTPENWAEICKHIDVNSFADGYIADEMFKLADLDYTSFYLYYDSSDKLLHRGIIWDYDSAIGNARYHGSAVSFNSLWATNIAWYRELLNHSEFRQILSGRFESLNHDFEEYLQKTKEDILSLKSSFERNFVVWDILGKYDDKLANWNTDEIFAIDTFEGQVEYVFRWILKSYQFLYGLYYIVN